MKNKHRKLNELSSIEKQKINGGIAWYVALGAGLAVIAAAERLYEFGDRFIEGAKTSLEKHNLITNE